MLFTPQQISPVWHTRALVQLEGSWLPVPASAWLWPPSAESGSASAGWLGPSAPLSPREVVTPMVPGLPEEPPEASSTDASLPSPNLDEASRVAGRIRAPNRSDRSPQAMKSDGRTKHNVEPMHFTRTTPPLPSGEHADSRTAIAATARGLQQAPRPLKSRRSRLRARVLTTCSSLRRV